MKAKLRPTPEMLSRAKEAAMDAAHKIIQQEADDVMKRATNLVMMAMMMSGLSPKTGWKIMHRLTDTVVPLWENRIQKDAGGKSDGDWSICHELEKNGWPAQWPESEM